MSAPDPAPSALDRPTTPDDPSPFDRPSPPARPHEPATSFEFWGRDRAAFGRPTGVPWFERLRNDPRVGVAALLATALLAGVLWYRIGIDATDEPVGASASSPAAEQTTPSPSPTSVDASGVGSTAGRTRADEGGTEVVVHVAGAVARPGIVRLRAGDRVSDAIEGAGGPAPGAALDQLNLAAKVADGQWIGVGLPGQPVIAPGSGAGGGSTGSAYGAAGAAAALGGGLLNLNTATQAEIEELPGIGPVLGAAILRERDERGGFRAVDELRSVRGIGEKRFADLRDLVTV